MKAPWKEPLRIAGDIGVAGNAVWEVVDADGAQVADVLIVDAEALVHRANAYPALVDSLAWALAELDADGGCGCEEDDCDYCGPYLRARAALAATKEGESDG